MSATAAQSLLEETILPAARLLELGPLQNAAGPGGHFPGELSKGQRLGTHCKLECEEPAACTGVQAREMVGGGGRRDVENTDSLQVHWAQGREEHTPPVGTRSGPDGHSQSMILPSGQRDVSVQDARKRESAQSGLYSMGSAAPGHCFSCRRFYQRKTCLKDSRCLIRIVRRLQEPAGLLKHSVAHSEFQALALGIIPRRDDVQSDKVPRVVGRHRLVGRSGSGRTGGRGHEAYKGQSEYGSTRDHPDSKFVFDGVALLYIEALICLRAAFSSLDTCACEIPISSATSI